MCYNGNQTQELKIETDKNYFKQNFQINWKKLNTAQFS